MRYEEEQNRVYRIIDFPNGYVKEGFGMIMRVQMEYNENKVKATVVNYLNQVKEDFSGPVIFEYEGIQIESIPSNGVAVIEFDSTIPGEHIVKTVNPNMENSEVIIHV